MLTRRHHPFHQVNKTMNRFISLLIPALAILVLMPSAAAQDLSYATGNPADWPPELDAVIAAPDNHRILLENDRVRVLEVTLGPGEVEPLHHHRWPSVLHITAADHFIDRNADDEVIMDTRELDAPLPMPLTMWKEAEAPHSVENLSSTETIRLIRIEQKADSSDPAADRAVLKATTAVYETAIRAGDHAAIAALHANDAVIQPANEPEVRGRKALDDYFAATHADPQDMTFTTDDIVIAKSGEMAYEVGAMSGPGWSGKYLTIFQRTTDGWRIVADSWSNDTPPAAEN